MQPFDHVPASGVAREVLIVDRFQEVTPTGGDHEVAAAADHLFDLHSFQSLVHSREDKWSPSVADTVSTVDFSQSSDLNNAYNAKRTLALDTQDFSQHFIHETNKTLPLVNSSTVLRPITLQSDKRGAGLSSGDCSLRIISSDHCNNKCVKVSNWYSSHVVSLEASKGNHYSYVGGCRDLFNSQAADSILTAYDRCANVSVQGRLAEGSSVTAEPTTSEADSLFHRDLSRFKGSSFERLVSEQSRRTVSVDARMPTMSGTFCGKAISCSMTRSATYGGSSLRSVQWHRFGYDFSVLDQLDTACSQPVVLPEAIVQRWAAEMLIALSRLHSIGIVCRYVCMSAVVGFFPQYFIVYPLLLTVQAV